jgi:hypothetical protein
VHLVGFIIRIYHAAQSSECQILSWACNWPFSSVQCWCWIAWGLCLQSPTRLRGALFVSVQEAVEILIYVLEVMNRIFVMCHASAGQWHVCYEVFPIRASKVYSSSSSIGSATLVGFGLLNYRWVFSAGRFLQSAVASGTSNPQPGGPVI